MTFHQTKDEFSQSDADLVQGSLASNLQAIAGLVTDPYDYILVTSTNANGDPTEIVYRSGGAGGTIVATITVTYDANGNFESASKA